MTVMAQFRATDVSNVRISANVRPLQNDVPTRPRPPPCPRCSAAKRCACSRRKTTPKPSTRHSSRNSCTRWAVGRRSLVAHLLTDWPSTLACPMPSGKLVQNQLATTDYVIGASDKVCINQTKPDGLLKATANTPSFPVRSFRVSGLEICAKTERTTSPPTSGSCDARKRCDLLLSRHGDDILCLFPGKFLASSSV